MLRPLELTSGCRRVDRLRNLCVDPNCRRRLESAEENCGTSDRDGGQRRCEEGTPRAQRSDQWAAESAICGTRQLPTSLCPTRLRALGRSSKPPSCVSRRASARDTVSQLGLRHPSSVCPTAIKEWSVGLTNRLDQALVTQSHRRRALSRPGLHHQAAVDAPPD